MRGRRLAVIDNSAPCKSELHEPAKTDRHYVRPSEMTRGDCVGGPRPCPLISCRYNNYISEVDGAGRVYLSMPGTAPEDFPAAVSCALDVADCGTHTLTEVAEILGVVRERVRQLQFQAHSKNRKKRNEFGI